MRPLSKKSLRKVAGPDTLGPGVSSMGGGGGMSGGAGGANPTYTAGPSIAAPDGIGSWKCNYPGCRRMFSNGGDLRDHLWDDHKIKDIG